MAECLKMETIYWLNAASINATAFYIGINSFVPCPWNPLLADSALSYTFNETSPVYLVGKFLSHEKALVAGVEFVVAFQLHVAAHI